VYEADPSRLYFRIKTGVSGLFGFQVSDSGPNPFERSFKGFLLIHLSRAEDKRFQLLEPEGRVLKSPAASLSPSIHKFGYEFIASGLSTE